MVRQIFGDSLYTFKVFVNIVRILLILLPELCAKIVQVWSCGLSVLGRGFPFHFLQLSVFVKNSSRIWSPTYNFGFWFLIFIIIQIYNLIFYLIFGPLEQLYGLGVTFCSPFSNLVIHLLGPLLQNFLIFVFYFLRSNVFAYKYFKNRIFLSLLQGMKVIKNLLVIKIFFLGVGVHKVDDCVHAYSDFRTILFDISDSGFEKFLLVGAHLPQLMQNLHKIFSAISYGNVCQVGILPGQVIVLLNPWDKIEKHRNFFGHFVFWLLGGLLAK